MDFREDSNCHMRSDSFSIYERFLKSFNVVDNIAEENNIGNAVVLENYDGSNSSSNIALSAVVELNVDKQCESAVEEINSSVVKHINKLNCESSSISQAASLLDNSSVDQCLTDKSEAVDIPVTSEDSKPEIRQPIFITSTMENSNNAVDSLPMFRNMPPSQTVFKLPIKELSFNGTIKHVKKLKPIVDPLTALSSNTSLVALSNKSIDENIDDCSKADGIETLHTLNSDIDNKQNSISDDHSSYDRNIKSESTGDSQYDEFTKKRRNIVHSSEEGSCSKWNSEQSYSSLEASFDSGVRSPDLFSDVDDDYDNNNEILQQATFWSFQKDFEAHHKKSVRKIENILQGVLPPPSVTILKTDVTQMLEKYYCFLPAFTSDQNVDNLESNSVTPTKKVSFIHIPTDIGTVNEAQKMENDTVKSSYSAKLNYITPIDNSKSESELNSSSDKTVELKMCTQTEAINTAWPEVLKCKHHDVYYNNTKYSEQLESLYQRYIERFVGAETDTSVSVHSGGLQSPSSAVKRKALRLAQAKSPGRRLSHLARRRQTFCSAANISQKVQSSTSKMVYIDKNFFPHRKLINISNGKSPRKLVSKRTPGKKTPTRKTPGKKTPSKTPKAQSGGSSRKKAMRRLLMDSENVSRTQPTRETLKRALFVSPEGRKTLQPVPSSSVALQTIKSRRALFGSPVTAETKSSDGSQSDQFLKRKFDALDGEHQNSRSKILKSFSFGGDTMAGPQSHVIQRRASEVLVTKNTADLNEHHKQKLLWAVSVALRIHGWGMSSPGFREKASTLARLTRKLLTLPPHAARLAAPNLSTSDTMLKIARKYVFPIIQGRTVEDCFEEEKTKLASEANSKITGYISESAYQQLKAKQAASSVSKIKENSCTNGLFRQEQPKSSSKNILQDKLVNIDSNSNSSSGLSMLDRNSLGLFKSNSMPSFEETAKMRARRQISFDNVDFPKR